MASRMDRYNENEKVNLGRSSKNKSLYDQIEDLDSYSNIEGVATIEKTNEIDISKVKEMLKNRENYKKRKKLRALLEEEKEILEDQEEEIEPPKNYDIRDVLSKLNSNDKKDKYRSLNEDKYNLLRELDKAKENRNKKEEFDYDENQNADLEDVGLLDDLKSDTMVGDASSIKKIIDEEKDNVKESNTMELDKSFYTSSFGFTSHDFEELKNINHKIKKSNKCIIILLIAIVFLIIAGVLVFIFK